MSSSPLKVRHYKKKQLARVFTILATFFLASCTEPELEKPTLVLQEGMVSTVKAFGEYFSSEVVEIDEQVVAWESSWEGQVVLKQKLYQNIFPIAVTSDTSTLYYRFDHKNLEPLFPLRVGASVKFNGTHYHSKNQSGVPFWAVISVKSKGIFKFEGKPYETFLIKIVTDTKIDNGKIRNLTTLWHAKDLGVNLKVKQQTLGEGVDKPTTFETVKVEFPDQQETIRGVGTTRINFETSKVEDLDET